MRCSRDSGGATRAPSCGVLAVPKLAAYGGTVIASSHTWQRQSGRLPAPCRCCGGRLSRRMPRRPQARVAPRVPTRAVATRPVASQPRAAAAAASPAAAATLRELCRASSRLPAAAHRVSMAAAQLTCPAAPVRADLAPGEQVFVVPVTGEVFRDHTCVCRGVLRGQRAAATRVPLLHSFSHASPHYAARIWRASSCTAAGSGPAASPAKRG